MAKIIGLINLSCGFIHILFQFYLFNQTFYYLDILLIENILVALVFTYMGILFFTKSLYKSISFQVFHMIFWVVFLVHVIYIQPYRTTLVLVEGFILLPPQWIILSITSLITILLSLKVYILMKNDKTKESETCE